MPTPCLHNKLTGHSVITTAKNAHAQLGSGYSERTCKQALAAALQGTEHSVTTRVRAAVRNAQGHVLSIVITDLIVDDPVAVELKAIQEQISETHKAQLLAWLRAQGLLAVGLVINFSPHGFDVARMFVLENCAARLAGRSGGQWNRA